MTEKIFYHAFTLGALVLVICMGIFFGLQYRQVMDETYAALQQEASYAVNGLEASGIDYLRSLENINRITWIGPDGSVRYDSQYPALDADQSGFKEVQDALTNGSGQGVRRSSTGGNRTMYYAVLCGDGTVLRLSRPLSDIRYNVVRSVLWVIILVLIISAVMAFRIANRIAEPVNELDLDDLPHASIYPELQPLVGRLLEQRQTIERQVQEREELRREALEEQARERERQMQERERLRREALERQVREREEQGKERERMRREFTANVSHELKTPLTSISGFAELMCSGLCDEERMIEFAGDIYHESRRLIVLVNDILHLSEMDEMDGMENLADGAGGLSDRADLLEIARSTAARLLPAAEKRRVLLTVTGEAAPVYGSIRMLEEMVYNLCDNAIKYNREGGSVCVRAGNETGETDAEKTVFLVVEDTGIGIPKEEQERIFERFYRVDKSHSRKIGGTGLGLSIVKHGAQLHGASIEVDSAPGEGTRITLRFPQQNSYFKERKVHNGLYV